MSAYPIYERKPLTKRMSYVLFKHHFNFFDVYRKLVNSSMNLAFTFFVLLNIQKILKKSKTPYKTEKINRNFESNTLNQTFYQVQYLVFQIPYFLLLKIVHAPYICEWVLRIC